MDKKAAYAEAKARPGRAFSYTDDLGEARVVSYHQGSSAQEVDELGMGGSRRPGYYYDNLDGQIGVRIYEE